MLPGNTAMRRRIIWLGLAVFAPGSIAVSTPSAAQSGPPGITSPDLAAVRSRGPGLQPAARPRKGARFRAGQRARVHAGRRPWAGDGRQGPRPGISPCRSPTTMRPRRSSRCDRSWPPRSAAVVAAPVDPASLEPQPAGGHLVRRLCRHHRAAAGDLAAQCAAISDRQGAGRCRGRLHQGQARRQGQRRAADPGPDRVPRAALRRVARSLQDDPGRHHRRRHHAQSGQQGGRLCDDEHHPARPIRMSTSCSAPTRSCSARSPRCEAAGKARPEPVPRRHRRRAGGGGGDQEGQRPYKASISLASPVFGYAMGQHAADWLEGKSIPQAMDILPIALTGGQHRAVRGRPRRSGARLCRPGAARRVLSRCTATSATTRATSM